MADVSGIKFPTTHNHLHQNISFAYNELDVSFAGYPSDKSIDPDIYKAAIDARSAVTIFTPDITHYPNALYAIKRGDCVLITKPATKLLSHHLKFLESLLLFEIVKSLSTLSTTSA
jgi:D-galacturonate reductase